MVMPRPEGPFVSATSKSSTSFALRPGSSAPADDDEPETAMGESASDSGDEDDDWGAFVLLAELSCTRLVLGVDETAPLAAYDMQTNEYTVL